MADSEIVDLDVSAGVTDASLFEEETTVGTYKVTGLQMVTYVAGKMLAAALTWTGVQSFTDATLKLLGATSGFSILKAPASGGGTVNLPVGNANLLAKDVTDTISVGYKITPYDFGTKSSGTFTPDAANGNYQFGGNNGAHTLAAPAADSAVDLLYTNGASAGAITFSGFTVGSNVGSALTTTSGHKFIISIRRINSVATYSIYALQ